MTAMGVLNPIAKYLKTNTLVETTDGKNLTLANVIGLNHSLVAFVLVAIIVIVWVLVARKNKSVEDFGEKAKSFGEALFKRGWNWLPTGVVIGLIGILAFPLSAATGRNYPLGITAGWVNIW